MALLKEPFQMALLKESFEMALLFRIYAVFRNRMKASFEMALSLKAPFQMTLYMGLGNILNQTPVRE